MNVHHVREPPRKHWSKTIEQQGESIKNKTINMAWLTLEKKKKKKEEERTNDDDDEINNIWWRKEDK